MTDVHQPAVVVLGVPISPELVQLIVPGIAEYPEPRARNPYSSVVLREPGATRPERLQISLLPESPEPPGTAWSGCVIRHQLGAVGDECDVSAKVGDYSWVGRSSRRIVE
jgi:hypothetical protein